MAETSVKLTGIDGVISLLESLPAELVSKNGGPVYRSLRAGARVLAKEAALNVARATGNLTADESESTGLLQRSIIVKRGKAPSEGNGERAIVTTKLKSYTRKGKPVTTRKTASLLEYGSEKQPAEPWIRPAMSKAPEAIQTTTRELVAGLDRIVARLARKKGP